MNDNLDSAGDIRMCLLSSCRRPADTAGILRYVKDGKMTREHLCQAHMNVIAPYLKDSKRKWADRVSIEL